MANTKICIGLKTPNFIVRDFVQHIDNIVTDQNLTKPLDITIFLPLSTIKDIGCHTNLIENLKRVYKGHKDSNIFLEFV